jgi:hypothetical protein
MEMLAGPWGDRRQIACLGHLVALSRSSSLGGMYFGYSCWLLGGVGMLAGIEDQSI